MECPVPQTIHDPDKKRHRQLGHGELLKLTCRIFFQNIIIKSINIFFYPGPEIKPIRSFIQESTGQYTEFILNPCIQETLPECSKWLDTQTSCPVSFNFMSGSVFFDEVIQQPVCCLK